MSSRCSAALGLVDRTLLKCVILLFRTLCPPEHAQPQATILAHELVHIRRGDYLVRLLELAATTVFWWHPVVWYASWCSLRELEEQCCDSRVVELPCINYGRTPLHWWTPWTSSPTDRAFAVPMRTAIGFHRLIVQENSHADPKPNESSQCRECRAGRRTCHRSARRCLAAGSRNRRVRLPQGPANRRCPDRDSATVA